MQVINSMMSGNQQQQQQQQQTPQNDTPWMISTAAKSVGSIAGAVSCFMGFLNLLSIFEIRCIFVGALLIVEGFLMILTEAPCCCMFLDLAWMPANLLDKRPPWVKATIYLFFAAIPFLWCVGVSTFLSCGLIMATSALYLLIAMGKKANRDEMRVKSSAGPSSGVVTQQPTLNSAPTAILVQNEEVPVSTKPLY